MIIRAQRKEVGLKIYELAEKVGVSAVYITQIEKHNKRPSNDIFFKIAGILNLDRKTISLFLKSKFPDAFEKQPTPLAKYTTAMIRIRIRKLLKNAVDILEEARNLVNKHGNQDKEIRDNKAFISTLNEVINQCTELYNSSEVITNQPLTTPDS